MREAFPRRRRLGDPFVAPSKIIRLLDEFLAAMETELKPYLDYASMRKEHYESVIHLLQRASNLIRAQQKNLREQGRIGKIPNSILTQAVKAMEKILDRESNQRISFRTFVDNHLRLLNCPDDITKQLEKGELTLFEALQLKRLNTENLGVDATQAKLFRQELLQRYRRERWLAHRLRHEIDLKLGKRPQLKTPSPTEAYEVRAEIESVSETNLELENRDLVGVSLFGEQITLMLELLQSIDQQKISTAEVEKLFHSVDEVLLQLQKIHRKQQLSTPTQKSDRLGFLN